MAEIHLPNGSVVLVDDDDIKLVDKYKWRSIKTCRSTVYAATSGKAFGLPPEKTIYMHRVILLLGPGDERIVDHVDGNGLNNRRSNLRIVTRTINALNRKTPNGATPYIGVFWNKQRHKFQAACGSCKSNRRRYLGMFKTAKEANEAVQKARAELIEELISHY